MREICRRMAESYMTLLSNVVQYHERYGQQWSTDRLQCRFQQIITIPIPICMKRHSIHMKINFLFMFAMFLSYMLNEKTSPITSIRKVWISLLFCIPMMDIDIVFPRIKLRALGTLLLFETPCGPF